MKRILLPLLVLAILGLFGVLLWSQLARERQPADGTARGGASAGAGVSRLDTTSPGLAAPEEGANAPERASAASSTTAAGAAELAVTGEVRPPADCILDEDVEVFALARPADLDALMSAIGPRSTSDTVPTGDVGLVVARAKLDGRGRFRLTLPLSAKRAHLMLAGRSWYLRESITCDVSAGAKPIALQAECGGWIEGVVSLPAGAGAASALDGEIAELAPSLTNFTGGPGRMGAFFRRSERRASVKDGRFELRALDPKDAVRLDLASRAFADTSVEVAEIARGRATPLTVPLARGGAVAGRVLDAGGAPIAGAVVEASLRRGPFGMADRVVRTATSAADGAYELTAVAPGSVQITARSSDAVASEPATIDVRDGARSSGVDLRLGVGETIAGVVRWKDGSPAAGAEVSTSADRGQTFGPGPFRAAARRGDEPKAVADAQGRFVLRGLASGAHTLVAEGWTAEDAARIDRRDIEARRRAAWRGRASGVQAGASDAVLVLEPPLVVRGVVTFQDGGAPVTAFRVQASGAEAGRRGGGGGGFAMAFGGGQRTTQDFQDERGEFAFTFTREGSWKLTVSADGCVKSEAIDVEVPMKPDAAPLAVALARGATVKGIVRSPLGTPVANATVSPVTASQMPFGGRMPGAGEETIKARTDAEGRFTLRDLAAGRLVLVAESSAWARSGELALDLVAGGEIADAELVLRQGGTIVGESFEDGRPTAGRGVTAMQMSTFQSASARADAAGRFRFEHLPAGTWRVTAMPAANEIESLGNAPRGGGDGGMGAMFSRMKSASADVVEGQETHVVLGAAPKAPVAVRGRVTQGGAGVSGVRVSFLGQGDTFGPGMKTAQTDAEGTYALTLDQPGDYSITVLAGTRGMSMIEYVETVQPLPEVVLDFALPTARISGLVRTPENEPARGVRVSLYTAAMGVGGSMLGGGFNEVTTDEDGRFDVNGLRAGTYTLTVGGTTMGGFRGPGGMGGAGEARFGRKVVSDVELKEGEWRKDFDVRLEDALAAEIEVVDESGSPVMGASVFVRDEAGRPVDRMSTVRTDQNGKARYGGLASGTYTFSARKDALSSGESGKLDVRKGGSAAVKLALAQGTLLYVTTVDANDVPLRARVRVTDEAGRDVAGLMSAQDMMDRAMRGGPGQNEQKIGPLPPGKYTVRATTSDGKSVEKSVTLTGQAERRMTLALSG